MRRDNATQQVGKAIRIGSERRIGRWFARCILTSNAFYERSARTAGASIGSFPTTPPEERQEGQARWMRWPKYEPVKVAHTGQAWPAPPPSCSPTHTCLYPPPRCPRRRCVPTWRVHAHEFKYACIRTRVLNLGRTVLSLRARREVDEVKAKQARARARTQPPTDY